MSDLTRFNLKKHNFYIDTRMENDHPDCTQAKVVIFNFTDNIAFELPIELPIAHALDLKELIVAKGIVNLIRWDTSNYLKHVTKFDLFNGNIDPYCFGEPECPSEHEIYDEDGSIAFGEMLERHAQEHTDQEKEYFGDFY